MMGSQSTLCTVGQQGGQSALCTVGYQGGHSTKDLKDHLKTTHSQLEVFRPCFFMFFIHQVTPGSAVNLKVSSQPGSLCAISAIDRVGNIKGVTHKVLSCFICDTPQNLEGRNVHPSVIFSQSIFSGTKTRFQERSSLSFNSALLTESYGAEIKTVTGILSKTVLKPQSF